MKNPNDQQLFFEETSNTNLLTSSFTESSDFQKSTDIFFKRLNNCIRKCFKKVRIKSNNSSIWPTWYSRKAYNEEKVEDFPDESQGQRV